MVQPSSVKFTQERPAFGQTRRIINEFLEPRDNFRIAAWRLPFLGYCCFIDIISYDGNDACCVIEGVVAQWCNSLTLKPEQSGGVGSRRDRASPLERHDKEEVADSIST